MIIFLIEQIQSPDFEGNITPIKDREFINLKRGFYFLLIENENRIILKRRLIT